MRLRFDCDTAEGVFSDLKQVQPGPSYRIAGRISAIRLRLHEHWEPAGTLTVTAADGKMAVSLQIVAPKRPDGPLDLLLLVNAVGQPEQQKLLGQAPIGEELPFELVVEAGKASARIGTMHAEAQAGVGTGGTASASCSTGEFLFTDLSFGPSSSRASTTPSHRSAVSSGR
jgi:hypothetical protein